MRRINMKQFNIFQAMILKLVFWSLGNKVF